MKTKNIFYLYFILTGLINISCEHETPASDYPTSFPSKPVEFSIEMADSPFMYIDMEEENGPTVELDPLEYYFHPGESVLLISQRGQGFEPFSEVNPTKTYKYTYYVNEEANWDYGYNFEPFGEDALDWKLIADNQFNGSYAFGALYYPIENEQVTAIQEDQRSYNNFIKSDILGTYHSTSELESRLRFRLFHLMACINLKLLVPDWSEEDNTGFFDNAVKESRLLNTITNFDLVFGNKSTEEPPTASTEKLNESIIRDVLMHPVDPSINRDIIIQDLTDFKVELKEDKVREYRFQVLLPTQTLSSDNALMRFTLTRNGNEKHYTFSSKNIQTGSLSVAQGNMTNLTLYLPRFKNEALLIKAEIVNWKQGDSDFTARPRNQ